MTKRMLWTERLFQLLPVGKEHGSYASFLTVRLIRSLCLTLIIMLITILIAIISGYTGYNNIVGFGYPFALIFLVLVVSGWFRNKWDWFFGWSSHILKLNETEFGKFRDRREKFINNSFACLVIALILYAVIVIPGIPLFISLIGSTTLAVYAASLNFIAMLFLGTLIWIIVSMWITLFVTLRQPLNLKLSYRADEEFRPLAVWGLKVLLVTFVLVAIVAVFYNLGFLVSAAGFAGIIVGMIFIVTLGVVAFLLPFYHVHRVLSRLKKRELLEIEGESNKLMQDLAQASSNNNALRSEERMTRIMNCISSLQVLQIRERRARDADEWPIDTAILSAVAGLVLIPIVVNILTNLI